MARNNFCMQKISFVFACLFSSVAFSSDSSVTTVGDLDKIKGQIYYYKQLSERDKAMQGVSSLSLSPNESNSIKDNKESDPVLRDRAISDVPVVIKLMNNAVQIKFPDGTTDWKKVGQVVMNGYILSDVSVTGVWIKSVNGSNKIQLRFVD